MTTTPGTISYREFTISDVTQAAVADINVLIPQLSTSAKPLTREWLREVLKSGTRIFCAYDGDRIIGTVLLSPMKILVGQKDWIEDVVVDEAYRGRGIMRQLMDLAEGASAKGDAKSINLTSKPERGPARAGYEGRGYKLRETGVFRLILRR